MYQFLHDIVRVQSEQNPESIALSWEGGGLTYRDLYAEVLRAEAGLVARGVRPGDRVAVLSRNRAELVVLYFATSKAGAIFCPFNYWHRREEHEGTIAHCEPRLVFVEPELAETLPTDVAAAAYRLDADPFGPRWREFVADGKHRPETASPQSPHMLLYTSGTTGRPKGVVMSHARTISDGYLLLSLLRLRRADTFLGYFPPFHVGNWDVLKLFWMIGARVHLQRDFDERAVVDALGAQRISVLLGVPTMYLRLARALADRPADLSSLRLMWYGAFDNRGIMREAARAFRERLQDIEFVHTYGLTEGGPYLTVSLHEDIEAAWGSVGRALPGVELRLRDERGGAVPDGQAGELWFRGPRMNGYWRDPEATASVTDGDWTTTGDIARRDDEGFYWLVDRKKDVIRTGGQNVYAKEVEEALLEHPGVHEASVCGLPDDEFEERVVAAVVPSDGTEPSEELAGTIRADLRRRLAGYKVPKNIVFLDALPASQMGKVQKSRLRQMLLTEVGA